MFTKNDSGDEITGHEMSKVCGKYGEEEKNISGLGGEIFFLKKKPLVGRS
jgi:hypothetical protein